MGGKSQKVTNETKVPKYIEDAYKMLVSRGEGIVDTPYDPAMNQSVAGFSPTQTQAFQNIQGMQGVQNPYLQQAQQYAQTGAGSISPENISQYSNPFQSQVIDSTMAQIAKNNAVQQNQLKGNSVAQGGLRNSRLGVAQAELAGNQDMNTANILSQLNTQNYSQALSAAQADKARQFQGASAYGALGSQAQQAGYQDIAALLGAGAQQQGLEQLQLDAATQNATQQYQHPFQNTSWLASLVQGVGSNAGGTSTQTTPGPSALSQIAGVGLTALGMFSDERVKENVERVGQTDDGLPIYTFRYKGSPQTQMGLMAQDVEQVKPEAVGSLGGIKTVNYDRATESRSNAGPADLDGDGMISKLERMEHAAKGLGAIQKANGGMAEPEGIGQPAGFAGGGLTLTPDNIKTIMSLLDGNQKEMKAPEHINIGGRGFANGGLPGLDDESIEEMYSAPGDDLDPTYDLIKGFEGFAPVAKWDVRQHSGGYGTRAQPGERFTPELAEQRLREEVSPVNSWISQNVKVPLSPEQRAALNSFGYNLGVDDLQKLLPDINRGDWATVGGRMETFNKALNEKTGQLEPLAELTKRRLQEAAMVRGGEPAMRSALLQNAAESAQPRQGLGAQPAAAPEQAKEPGFLDRLFSGEPNLALMAAGLGILGGDSPHAGVNIGKGGLAGVQMIMQQRKAKEGAQKLAEAAALAQQRLGIQRESLDERKRHNMEIERLRAGSANKGPSFSKNVIWGVGPDGNPALLQPGDAGEAIATKLPEGYSVAKEPLRIDAGTKTILLDPVTRQPIGEIPKELVEAERQKAIGDISGKAEGQAKVDLPKVEGATDVLLSKIDALTQDAALPRMTGPIQGRLPNVTGDAARVQAKIDQLTGDAFLQAFNELKGGGAITEIEGQKAEKAKSRLAALTVNDADYLDALEDFKKEVMRLRDLARVRAGVAPASAPSSAPSGNTGGFKVLKVE